MADAQPDHGQRRFAHLSVRFGTCVARAFPLAIAVHAIEAILVLRMHNAVLDALPGGALRRYLIALMLGAGATALVCGLVCAIVDLVAERFVRVLAPALPGLVLGVEALRKSSEARGSALLVLGCIALGLALAVAVWVALRGHAITRLQHRGTAWSSLLLATLAAAGSVVVARSALPGALDRGVAPAAVAQPSLPPAALPVAKNLVVIVIDTLRADHMSCYGYARKTTPNLDRFATDAVVFDRCISPKSQTSPAIGSLFTGMYPRSTGIVKTRTVLMPEFTTLAEITKAAGFTNVGWSANSVISEPFGFAQGFDSFEFVRRANRCSDGADGALLTIPALKRVQELAQGGGRFFAYVQIVEPHSPYTPHADDLKPFRTDSLYGTWATTLKRNKVSYIDGIASHVWLDQEGGNVDGYVARYDAEIVHADRLVGAFVRGLDALGLQADTAVVVVADHGESMNEHHACFNHGIFAYEEQVRVPLLVRTQGVAAGTRRGEVVSLVGLMPTLLDLVGLEAPPSQIQEPSFRTLLAPGTPVFDDRWTMVSSGYHRQRLAYGLRSRDYKFIDNETQRSPWTLFESGTFLRPGRRFALTLSQWRDSELDYELYDLRTDGAERVNLAFQDRSRAREFAARLELMQAAARPPATLPMLLTAPELSPTIRDDMQGNGYLGGPGEQAPDGDAAESDEDDP